MTRKLTLCLAVATLLGGCGSGSKQGATSSNSRTPAASKSLPANPVSANMVSAVALNKTTGVPVEVRFEVKDRPQVALPVDIDLVIVPLSGSVDRVSGKVQADDGLDLVDGAQIPASDRPPEGVPIRHTIRVQAKQDGIFTFSAVVSVDAAGQTTTQTFSVPVIAGTGMPDLPTPGASTPDKRAGTAGSAPPPGHASTALAAKSAGAVAAQ